MIRLLSILMVCSFAVMGNADFHTQASWIGSEGSQSTPNTWLAFRKDFVVDQIPQQWKASIAADSKYWLWLNGNLVVFEGGLKRGPAPGASYFDEVDLKPYLNEGKNTLAILVWHFGKNGFSHVNSGTAGLLFSAVSPELTVFTDKSWKCSVNKAFQNTEVPHPNFRLPESNIRFDSRLDMKGWNLPEFTGRLGNAIILAKPHEAPFGKLVKRPIPLWKDSGLLNYTNQKYVGDTLKCTLPYNAQVTPYFKIKSKAGLTIHMQTDNYKGGSENNVRAEYITQEGVQTYESLGWMSGEEMWYVFPKEVEVLDVKYRETGYNSEIRGRFDSNDLFFNELWKRSARTLYITMRDSYMDCPDRERAQWWGDEVNELGEAFYALDSLGWQLAQKGIYELMNWQRADGTLFSPIPSGNWGKELPLQMLASVGWYGFYTQGFYSNDFSFVPAIYPGLRKYLHEVWEEDEDGIPRVRHGEWSWGDWGQNVDLGVLTTCWYYLALKAEKKFASQLGRDQDVKQITSMMQQIEIHFDQRFWNGKAYRTPSYTGQTDDRSQAMAVVSGLASKDKYAAITQVLKTEFHASPYMEKYIMEALFMMKEGAYALERTKKRYAKMMSYPHTTLFEGWGIGAEGFGGGTINHAWSGGGLTMLSQKVCGIEPLLPGFKKFKVEPQLAGLERVETLVPSRFGDIILKVEKTGKTQRIGLEVPKNTSALLVLENGKTLELGPGKHQF